MSILLCTWFTYGLINRTWGCKFLYFTKKSINREISFFFFFLENVVNIHTISGNKWVGDKKFLKRGNVIHHTWWIFMEPLSKVIIVILPNMLFLYQRESLVLLDKRSIHSVLPIYVWKITSVEMEQSGAEHDRLGPCLFVLS